MQRNKEDTNHGFPPGLAQPALRALHGAGYTRLEHLTQITEADLRKLHGMGPKAIGLLKKALTELGMSLKEAG